VTDHLDTPPADPVLARRAQVARWCAIGKQVGYGLIGLAIVAFIAGAVTNFGTLVVTVVVGSLVLSALALVPAIIFGYGVKMAESEERGEPFRH